MEADEILLRSAQVEKIDTVARRTFRLDSPGKNAFYLLVTPAVVPTPNALLSGGRFGRTAPSRRVTFILSQHDHSNERTFRLTVRDRRRNTGRVWIQFIRQPRRRHLRGRAELKERALGSKSLRMRFCGWFL